MVSRSVGTFATLACTNHKSWSQIIQYFNIKFCMIRFHVSCDQWLTCCGEVWRTKSVGPLRDKRHDRKLHHWNAALFRSKPKQAIMKHYLPLAHRRAPVAMATWRACANLSSASWIWLAAARGVSFSHRRLTSSTSVATDSTGSTASRQSNSVLSGGPAGVKIKTHYIFWYWMESLKVGYRFFQKRIRKRVGAEYQNKLVANQR